MTAVRLSRLHLPEMLRLVKFENASTRTISAELILVLTLETISTLGPANSCTLMIMELVAPKKAILDLPYKYNTLLQRITADYHHK